MSVSSVIKTNIPVVAQFAARFIALAGYCPEGKQLKVADGPRRIECKRKKGITDLAVKIVSTGLRLHVVVRVAPSEEGILVSLHKIYDGKPLAGLGPRDEKYLSGMLNWAEQVLPTASPVQPTSKVDAWRKDYADLYAILTGCSRATARKRLNTGFFVDQEETSSDERIEALLMLMREEDSLLCFDWKEDQRYTLLEDLANKRRIKKTAACDLGDDLSPDEWLVQFRQFLDQQDQCLVGIESQMDADIIGIAACNDLVDLSRLLRLSGRRLVMDVDPQPVGEG
jgi:hypothetical protein